MGKKDKATKKGKQAQVPLDSAHISLKVLARIYKLFLPHYKSQWKRLTLSYSAMAITMTFGALAAWPLKLIIDHVILANPLPPKFNFLTDYMQSTEPADLLLVFAAAFFILRVANTFLSYVHKIGLSIAGSHMLADFRERVFGHLQRLSLSFHKSWRSGDIVYRMTTDINEIKTILLQVPQHSFQRLFSIFLYITLMLFIDWELALISFSIIPIIWLANRKFGTGMKKATKKKKKKQSDMSSMIADNITAMALVQAYGREDMQHRLFAAVNKKSMQSGVKAIKLSKIFKRLNGLLISLGMALVVYFGGLLVLDETLLPGTLVLFTTYLKNLYGPLDKFSELIFKIAKSQVAGERMVELMDNEMVMEDDPDAKDAPDFRGEVEFDNVAFAYKDKTVFENLSLHVKAGEKIAIVGQSGAGKSTLVSLLLRFYDPKAGEIRFDGENLRKFKLNSLRDKVTILMQDATLFNQTIAYNIGFGKENATREEIVRAAKMARAHDFIESLPDGYDTMISEGGDNLSGGQKQRLNIARAIIRDTSIVVLDEPTTALDAKTEKELDKALKALTDNRTTFVIAHKFASIKDVDRIIVLEEDHAPMFGTHNELMTSSAEYKKLFDVQAKMHTDFIEKNRQRAQKAASV